MTTTATPLAQARFAAGWLLTGSLTLGVLHSPVTALVMVALIQVVLAAMEHAPWLRRSPQAAPASAWHTACLRLHLPLQTLLLAAGVVGVSGGADAMAGVTAGVTAGAWLPFGSATPTLGAALAAGVAVGWVTGSLGITYAHELGHRRSRLDRLIAWLLMGSVLYAHFMIEHYRGHHPRAATWADPATARRGESLWRFLPRTLAGSWRSAWALESAWLARRQQSWLASPLAWAVAMQAAGLVALGALVGWLAVVFWVTQAAMAVLLLETVNYIEHYGLERRMRDGRPEPFSQHHAWNADAALTNALLANLQRHSDHHVHPWKPYETLQALPGPQLPAGYAGCVLLAAVPRAWFAVIHPRLDRHAAATAAAPD